MINVLADKHLRNITDYCSGEVELQLFDPDAPLYPLPDDVQALLIRTVTKIKPNTFPDFPGSLEFIGTASAGTDHVDTDYLAARNIAFAGAAGCNARSVAEYVAVALLLWADANDVNIKEKTVGIIGVGHTGGNVQNILQAMDILTVAYDPPREKREPAFSSAELDEVLNCDILTFHTPLSNRSPYPTHHWLDAEKIAANSFALIINAARGGVIDERALLEGYNSGRIGDFILDVWENEPNFNDEVARPAFLKTPHIAGYSVQAKSRATRMILNDLCEHFSISDPQTKMNSEVSPNKQAPSTFWSLTDVLTHYHPIRDYETRLLMLVGRSDEDKIKGFNRIRTGHPLRNELICYEPPEQIRKQYPAVRALFNSL